MKKTDIFITIIILVAFTASFFLYPSMSDKMPIHWDGNGNIDGYGSKVMGLFLMPGILAAVFLLFLAIPKIAVYHENFKKFEKEYDFFKLAMTAFFILLYVFTLLPNFGYNINMNYFIFPAIALLFFSIGIILPKIKTNYFFGIRTPWTLSDQKVWNKTHEKAGPLFKFMGLIFLVSIFLPGKVWIIISVVLLSVIWIFYYSYREFKKLH